MRFPVFYGTKPKLSIEDMDNFTRGDYLCRILLQTKQGAPVVISEHKDSGIWKVTTASAPSCLAPRPRLWRTARTDFWILTDGRCDP